MILISLYINFFSGGKTSLIKFLLLEHVEQITCVALFSNTGIHGYEKNYSFLNPRYIFDEWNPTFIRGQFLPLIQKIHKNDPSKHSLLIFDDSIGMAKSLFGSPDSKRLITTLRHYGCSLIISLHQLQSEASTLIRNNITDLFLFRQTEPNGINIMYENYGKGSSNLSNKSEFTDTLMHLEDFNFLHYTRRTSRFQKSIIPYSLMPNFRIYLHPEDKDFPGSVFFGNNKEYNLSSIEKDLTIIEEDVDDANLFRNPEQEQTHEEMQLDNELFADLQPEQEETTNNNNEEPKKKRKRKQVVEEEPIEKEDPIEQQFNFGDSPEDIVRFRCIAQLDFAKTDEVLKRKILAVFPNFFNQDFASKPLEELLQLRRQMYSSFQIGETISGIKNQYELLSLGLKSVAQYAIGYSGPGLSLLDNIFQHNISMSTLNSLAKVKPNVKTSYSMQDQLLDLLLPSARVLYQMKNSVDIETKMNEIGNQILTPEEMAELGL